MDFVLRWPRRIVLLGWPAWLLFALWLTWKPFQWHLQYFKSPGPQYYRLILIGLPLFALAVLTYRVLRQRGLWRYELAALLVLLLAALLFYRPLAALVTLWIFLSCYAAGRAARERLGLTTHSYPEDLALSTGLGLGAFIFLLFVLGLLGLYRPWVLGVVLWTVIFVCLRQVRGLAHSLRGLHRAWASTKELQRPLVGVVVFFGAIFLLNCLIVTLAPSLAHDSLTMHLPSVRFYSAQQALAPVPFLRYSYFPQGFEVLMTAAYLFAGRAAAQMVSPLFFGLTALLTFAVARECGLQRGSALAATVFGAAIPFLHWTGSVAKNDMPLVFFQLAALHCYLRARRSPDGNWLRLGVFFVASSFAVKHVALFGAVPLAGLYLHLLWRRHRPWREIVILTTVFSVFGLCWQARTFALTGNPVYPIQWEWAVEPLRPNALRPTEWASIPYHQIPWKIHFDGTLVGYPAVAFESPSSNPMGVFLVLFAPAWIVIRRSSSNALERASLVFSGIYFLYWGAVWPVLRYAMAPILIIFVLTTARLWALQKALPGPMRALTEFSIAYGLLFSLLVSMIIEINAPQLRLFAGRIDDEQYLREALVTYPSLAYLQTNSRPGDYILSINNCRGAYAPDVARFRCEYFEDANLAPPAVDSALSEGEFEFLILPEDSLGQTLLDHLEDRFSLRRVYRDDHFSVYRFEGETEGSSAHFPQGG